jgi:DnaJ-class molecular chaperone
VGSEKMNKKIFNPENFGMVICLCCDGHGYIRNPERQCCPKCGGFGFIKKEAKADKNIATSNPLHANHISGEE